jgi:hypothetical protein
LLRLADQRRLHRLQLLRQAAASLSGQSGLYCLQLLLNLL